MDSNNWRPTQPDPQLPIDGGDWRSQLQPESRQRIVNKIMETLKRHLPFSGQEGLQELKQIAIRFEEKIYSAATSQSDYLRKISLKMLTMESKSQSTLPGAMPSNTAGVSRNPQDSVASQTMQSQVHNQSQSVPLQMVPNQSQTRQQLISQNMQNNIASGGMQTAVTLPNTLPPNGLAQNSLPSVPQNSNLQNVSGISQSSMGNTMNQGIASNMFSNAQRQMQARQLAQQVSSQQQPQQTQNQNYLYQQQLQQQILKQKLQQGNIQQPLMQTPLQQQQQPQAQQNLMQTAQQPMMQSSSVMQPSMVAGLQQNQQSSIQQPSQSVLQQHQQSVLRQQQQPPPQQTPVIQQQQPQLPQQSMMSSQQQQQQPQPQLMGQQPHTANIQHNQLLGQQSNISDMQQQQQRMIGQQNNVQSLQPQQQNSHQNMQQQQHVMAQQNSLQNLHQQQVGHQSHVGGLPQQQQLIGTQSNNGNMQTNQHSVQMIQQSKVPIQQQTQNGTSILPGGGQQPQQSQSQQQLSQLHSQPTQMQQQIGMQQQQPPPPNSLQHNMQQRMQNVNPLIQQQSLIDPQKQLYQSQRTAPEAPTTSLDSTAQTSSTNGVDWQEEVYQKIKAMRDMYFADLNEMYQKISLKLQQHDSLPQPPKIDQIDKLRMFKHMLERPIQLLQTTKNNILPAHRDKLQSFERQIVGLLNSNRLRKPAPSMQPGQVQSIQQLHSQNPQAQPHDGGVNPQMQPMNLQGQVATMQPINVPSSQNGTVTSLAAISSSQQTIPSSLQSSSAMDSGQASAPSSMQQVPNSTMQQNPASASQQANITSLQPQIAGGLLQSNMNHLQSNSNMLQNQHLKQQEQQMMQSQLLKQQSQSRMQQQFLQKQQLFQHHQQMQQQAKQQMASQMQSHQMPQLNQITDVNEKMRQMRSSAFPPHLSSTQRFANQQLKPGASFPVSSPQLLQAVSPQINQHSSPQIDQQNLPPSVSKGGTPLHSANSPFVPSPSTSLVPSPMPGDNEKPAVSSLSNVANVGHQQSSGAPQSLNIGTPGISPSPLFEIAVPDGTHGNTSTVVSGKSSVTEQPIERLLRAVRSITPEALNAAVSDISSVVSMVDRIAGSAPGNGSRATVGEDLVAMTKCRLQARNFLTQDGSSGTKRMRRYTSAMPLNVWDMNENLKQLNGPGTPELESTATSRSKKARIEVNHSLLEEIREINERLIDTVVEISDEDTDPSVTAPVAEGGEGTIVSCSFSAITLSPILRAQYTAAQMSPIQPLKLLVPPNYPNCSPVLLDKLPVGTSNEHEDLSVKAKSKFSISLRCLSQPMSLKDIARTWDDCARGVLSEYAQQNGGGTFSSKYGAWENCLSAA